MRVRIPILVTAFTLAAFPQSRADMVKTTKTSYTGKVAEISPTEVVFKPNDSGGATKRLPANEVVFLTFDDDPGTLRTARQHAVAGRYEEARSALERTSNPRNFSEYVRQDIEYYLAYCQARLAMQSQADGEGIRDAAKQMRAFMDNNKESYHWFKAAELFAELAVANGSFSAAEKAYAEVAKAPWTDYKMRSDVALGRIYLSQDKMAEAGKSFDSALALADGSEPAQLQKAAATIGKARVAAAQKKPNEAIKTLQPIIARLEGEAADSAQLDLLSYAYGALASARRAAGQPKEALYDFLRVDLMYPQVADTHAEALYNLGQLWEEFHDPGRAAKAKSTLKEQYKNSSWAKKD
jgi:tetratricopeptide (TPR) repeat protein